MMKLLHNEIWFPIKLSIEVATISLVFVLFSGIIIAKFMTKVQFKGKNLLETALLLPLVLPPTVIGFLLIIFLGPRSTIGSFIEKLFHQSIMFTSWAAILASAVVSFPLMYQTVKNGFQSVDMDIEDAARVDGANEKKVFLYVTLPLSARAVLTGLILSFARALGEFGATLMFAGNIPEKTQTVPTAIYIAMDSGNMETAWILVISMIVMSSLMLLVANFIKD